MSVLQTVLSALMETPFYYELGHYERWPEEKTGYLRLLTERNRYVHIDAVTAVPSGCEGLVDIKKTWAVGALNTASRWLDQGALAVSLVYFPEANSWCITSTALAIDLLSVDGVIKLKPSFSSVALHQEITDYIETFDET